ncbi:O-antigen ligase family protein [Venenivibrio stagnispumantis]|uniref:O-Antigen ligase n=1 Tax=Venenivibrio stagnispumantis TaxID=407998 RepID=A0AA45WPF5_9AQUI|nr:hypothetical protein [Venenivibrio stagnispumantis]MCW4574013.1 hypothetical protein [Venenivibrio stagnispumantis]SMP21195.1 hypothetical protein SAMN06264868_12231 [Venenivibrio stagnispumantis]
MESIKKKENILIILLASAYISISLFEIFIILFLIWELYLVAKKEIKPRGVLTVPLFTIMVPSIASTLIYGKLKDLSGVLNQNFFFISYFMKDIFNPTTELFKKLNTLVIIFCSIEAVVTFYNYFVLKVEKPIWGGVFEVGIIFALGSISAFIMFLIEKDKKFKVIYFALFIIFTGFVFLTGKRNPILGIIFIYLITLVKLLRLANINRKFIIAVLSSVLILFVAGNIYAFYKFPKYQIMFRIITFDKTLTQEELNEFSSARWEIGKKGIEVIEKDIKNRDFLPLLIGHGYNSGYYLEPPSPVGRTYESIFLISELIQKGLIGLFGILLFMYLYFKFILTIKINDLQNFIAWSFAVFPTYFLIGGIFSGMWDAILPLYILLFGLSERFYSMNNEKNSLVYTAIIKKQEEISKGNKDIN